MRTTPIKTWVLGIRDVYEHVYEYPCFYGSGAHASTVVHRPSSHHRKRPGNEARERLDWRGRTPTAAHGSRLECVRELYICLRAVYNDFRAAQEIVEGNVPFGIVHRTRCR